MDKSVEKLQEQGLLGTILTEIDWKILLQDASDFGSHDGVLVASHKLHCKPSNQVMENLLLATLRKGEYGSAISVCKELQRNLSEIELALLFESAILLGKVQEITDYVFIANEGMLSMLHTAIAIAVFRQLRQKMGTPFPARINLNTWAHTYSNEFLHFNLTKIRIVKSKTVILGTFLIFSKDSLYQLLIALLEDDQITWECATKIMSFNF